VNATTESQITSDKAESIRNDMKFMSMMADYGTGFARSEEDRIIAHIEAVREKDREEASLQAQDALGIVVRNLEADRDHWKAMAEEANIAIECEKNAFSYLDTVCNEAQNRVRELESALAVRKAPDIKELDRYVCGEMWGMELAPSGEYVKFADVLALLSPAQQEPVIIEGEDFPLPIIPDMTLTGEKDTIVKAALAAIHEGKEATSTTEAGKCWCATCRPVTPFGNPEDNRMVLCPTCGNKRCPHANDHRNACTNSNEPGQPGSSYPAARATDAACKPEYKTITDHNGRVIGVQWINAADAPPVGTLKYKEGVSIQDLIAEHKKDPRKKAALDRAREHRATPEGGHELPPPDEYCASKGIYAFGPQQMRDHANHVSAFRNAALMKEIFDLQNALSASQQVTEKPIDQAKRTGEPQLFSYTTREDRCEVRVAWPDGDVLLYVKGDYKDTEPVAWIDPQALVNFKAGTATKEWIWANEDFGLVPVYGRAAPLQQVDNGGEHATVG
jgi:hypothetical protein